MEQKNMYKRVLALVCALAFTLALCGCDSMDYQTAMNAYQAEDYAAAREIFAKLGEYEDSADMVKECDYRLALEYMEVQSYSEAKALLAALGQYKDSADRIKECDYRVALGHMEAGQYKQARELFLALGAYEDCTENALKAAHCMLTDYVQQLGQLVNQSSDNSNSTALEVAEGKLVMTYAYKTSGLLGIDVTISAQIQPGQTKTVITGVDTHSSIAGAYEATASCPWDITTYKSGAAMMWAEFAINGMDSDGQAYAQATTWLDRFFPTAIKDMTAHLQRVLADSGLGLTMADIGFAAY